MKAKSSLRKINRLMLLCVMLLFFISGCTSPTSVLSFSDSSGPSSSHIPEDMKSPSNPSVPSETPDRSRYLIAVEEEPDTFDFQCTTIHYTVAANVFDRLVEMKKTDSGEVVVTPSLAESWEISDDRCRYTFHLHDGISFSNGSPLTSSDVLYSFTRLLTWPGAINKDIVEEIAGAEELEQGLSDTLKGFEIINDLEFTISLQQPYEAFLACLSVPGASILDEETTKKAEDRFGIDPEYTIGTGPFIINSFERGKGMIFSSNPNCWSGPPKCDGLDLRFISDPEELEIMFENNELDILDLDDVGDDAEYFIRGDIYHGRVYEVPQIGIIYIALNESMHPLDDVRVRKALQFALNRELLLEAVYLGYGSVENGIYPRGLYGYDPNAKDIPYDPEKAKELMDEAGYHNGFELTVTIKNSSTQSEMTQMKLVSSMWEKIGVRTRIELIDDDSFLELRKEGKLQCYTATWSADYNDPDNFIYPFFGNRENSIYRSLCFSNEPVMERVRNARYITDSEERIKEYRSLEKRIIKDEAAWIPLFSRHRIYVVSERAGNVEFDWNGSIKNCYRRITIK